MLKGIIKIAAITITGAYEQWSATVGNQHRNTANAIYKVACHYSTARKDVDAL